MPNLLIVGETGNGKTMIVNLFLSRYPAADLASSARATLPVLSIQAPPVPEEGRFYNEILDRVAAPYRPNDRVERKQFQAVRVLREIGVRLLIIDEIHHILAGPIAKQRHFLNTIKYLSNELRIPMVGVGTKEAFHALHTDPQLASRFMPALLPRWELNEDYLRLLASFAQMLPLKQASDLTAPDLAELVLTMSEGTIGEIAALLSTAAVAAIRTGRECIDTTLLRQLDWVVPSARKWQADRLG
jgi:type II secretory pathway predicted ATPase ExeA